MKLILVMAFAAALVGCTAQPAEPATTPATTPAIGGDLGTVDPACQQAVEDAVTGDPMQTTQADLDEAIRTCTTFEDLEQVLAQFPTAIDAASTEQFVRERCEQEAALADTVICQEVTD